MANVVNENMYNQLVQLYKWDTAKADKYKASIENTYSADKYNELVNNLNKLYWSSSSTPTTNTTKTNTVSQASNWISQASLDANRNNAKAWTWYVAPISVKALPFIERIISLKQISGGICVENYSIWMSEDGFDQNCYATATAMGLSRQLSS